VGKELDFLVWIHKFQTKLVGKVQAEMGNRWVDFKATRYDFWAQHCSMKNAYYFLIGPKLKKMEHNSFPNNREINCC